MYNWGVKYIIFNTNELINLKQALKIEIIVAKSGLEKLNSEA